jgi:hypothetical protein
VLVDVLVNGAVIVDVQVIVDVHVIVAVNGFFVAALLRYAFVMSTCEYSGLATKQSANRCALSCF